jgi:hypothetical protein
MTKINYKKHSKIYNGNRKKYLSVGVAISKKDCIFALELHSMRLWRNW